MGLFDFLKKKTDQTTHAPINKIDISKTLIQDVTLQMVSMRVISDPMMKFLYDDKGILDRLFHEHTTDKEFLAIKQQSEFNYLFVCGMHAFGAGIFVTAMQPKLEKAVSDYSTEDVSMIISTLFEHDAYEVGLATLGLSVESNNKKVFDKIIITAIESAMANAPKTYMTSAIIKQLMQTLFNAGVTVVMR